MQQEEERGRTGRKPWVKNGEGAEARQGWMEAAVWRRKKKEPFGCCSSLDSPFPPPCVLSLSLYPSVLRPPPPHAEEGGGGVPRAKDTFPPSSVFSPLPSFVPLFPLPSLLPSRRRRRRRLRCSLHHQPGKWRRRRRRRPPPP